MATPLSSLEGAKSELVSLAIHSTEAADDHHYPDHRRICWRLDSRATARALHRLNFEPPVRLLLTRVARLIVLLLFFMMTPQNLGVELLPLIAGLGIAGAGIALATQGVLNNVIAGLTIIFTKPYRVRVHRDRRRGRPVSLFTAVIMRIARW